jgi:acid phosphatase family membrane protein YuiD
MSAGHAGGGCFDAHATAVTPLHELGLGVHGGLRRHTRAFVVDAHVAIRTIGDQLGERRKIGDRLTVDCDDAITGP